MPRGAGLIPSRAELTQILLSAARLRLYPAAYGYGYRRLVVFSGREHRRAWSDSGVFRDQRGHHTAMVSIPRQRGNVQQQYVFTSPVRTPLLNSSTDGYSFNQVTSLRAFTKEFSNFLLNHWHTSLTTNDNVVDIRYGQASVLQCKLQRSMERSLIFNQLSSSRQGQSHFDVPACFGPVASGSDVR